MLPAAEKEGIVEDQRAVQGDGEGAGEVPSKRTRQGDVTDAGEAGAAATERERITYDPLFKAKRAAARKKDAATAAAAAAAAGDVERRKKAKMRRMKSRQYGQRTDRGQPIMKHRIKDLLGKIQSRK